MPILVRRTGEKWQRANDKKFADEAQLQKMLYEAPELIPPDDQSPAVFIREAGLPGSGHTDLLGVDADGNILIVETKLAKNSEVRRKVIGQILEYAAYLWEFSYEEFNELFLMREKKSIGDLLTAITGGEPRDGFREAVTENLRSGSFHLFIAVDEMNDDLERIITYVSSRGSGLKLQAVELRVFELEGLEIVAPERHGEFVKAPSPHPAITVEEALANCPDEHSRTLFKLLVESWGARRHEVKPGMIGVAFRANVGGKIQSIFWASRGDLQGAFSVLSKNGAPADAVQAFRSVCSQLRGFDGAKFMHDSQPIVKFANIGEVETKAFLDEADRMVQLWRESVVARDAVELSSTNIAASGQASN